MIWKIGCSGFSYRDWMGKFYPDNVPQSKWFEYYCGQFNTVELNVTFYRFPTPKMLEGWYKRSPADFKFTVKAPRLITHYKRFSETQQLTYDFYASASAGLKEKLATVLFQFPGSIVYSEELLEKILSNLNPEFTNVVEFRHRSWWREDVYKRLAEKKICFCSVSLKNLPKDIVHNTSVIYYRFHGVPRLYRSQYRLATLKKIVDEVKTMKHIKNVYFYFNNDNDTAAINNVRQVIGLIEETSKS